MKTILQFGYVYIVVPQESVAAIVSALPEWEIVNREYIDGDYLYTPEEKPKEINILVVTDDRVRAATPKEKENEKIKDLTNSLEWKEAACRAAGFIRGIL